MKVVTYTFANGDKSIIEVDGEVETLIIQCEKDERNSYQKLHRRSRSLSAYKDDDEIFADDTDVADDVAPQEKYDILKKAIEQLPEKYKELIDFLYIQEMTIDELSKAGGRSKSAISHQKKTALKHLKKIFETFF